MLDDTPAKTHASTINPKRRQPLRPAVSAVVVLTLAVLTGCAEKKVPQSAPVITVPATSTTTVLPVGAPPPLKLTPIAALDAPITMAQRTGDDALYVVEKGGRIRVIRNGIVDTNPVLDIVNTVSTGSEQGLLGLAFAPGKPQFYVNYTDKNGDTHIVEYTLGADGLADIGTRRELIFQKQPASNHNGGQLAFGPDGQLYIGLGDGGGSGDPKKNGQNLSVLLGKILRINPTRSNELPYTIPADNPFSKRAGARGEIWAYGLRNPWRFSFDRDDKSMWIADVGQVKWEEINRVEADPRGGKNFGWPLREGLHQFDGNNPKDAVEPVHEYNHDAGRCSITGGYVYRGTGIPDMAGRYLFGDYCSGDVWSLTKRGTAWAADELSFKVPQLASFGEDRDGNVYVLSQKGQVSRIDPAGPQ